MGINTPVRVNAAGNIECLSSNHHDCAWQSNHEACDTVKQSKLLADATDESPLVCGAQHFQEWGSTGYDSPHHWCAQAYRTLVRPPSPPPTSWTCVPNILTPLRVNATSGEVECMSSNHHDCLWQSSAENCQLLVDTNAPPGTIDPLECGAHHQAEWGVPGYGDATHWCDIAKPLLASTYRPWECVPGIFTPVRRTSTGAIHCLSTNSRDCSWQTSDVTCKAAVAALGASIAWGTVKPLTCPPQDLVTPYHWCQQAKTYYDAKKTTTTPFLLWTLALASVESVEWPAVVLAATAIVGCVLGFLAFVVVHQRSNVATHDDSMATNDYYIALVHT
ncbi:hypothetical protein DYB34_013693 [Aphanomyces astaci]|uniref:Uncharacterized protein n=1 Tax=Aphanomyces astaci TaxID=112090 RepID=A0A3R6Z2Z3_APHAT|nr:hypothetical protein DYB34_013693 [Aphanomyces astaci]